MQSFSIKSIDTFIVYDDFDDLLCCHCTDNPFTKVCSVFFFSSFIHTGQIDEIDKMKSVLAVTL